MENQQVNINNLMEKILEEVDEIDKYTCFGRDWSLLYYYACGWKKTLCQEFVNTEEKHKKLIHFTKEVFKPDVSHNVGGSLKVTYRLESPSLEEVKDKKELIQ